MYIFDNDDDDDDDDNVDDEDEWDAFVYQKDSCGKKNNNMVVKGKKITEQLNVLISSI